MLKVKVVGDRELAIRFDKNIKTTPKNLELGIKKSLALIKRNIHRYLTGRSLRVRTGALRESITQEIHRGKDPYGRIGSNLVYARIHELGGEIRPVRATYLHFKVGDQWVKTKLVRMPKRPYMAPAFKDSMPGIMTIFKRATRIK